MHVIMTSNAIFYFNKNTLTRFTQDFQMKMTFVRLQMRRIVFGFCCEVRQIRGGLLNDASCLVIQVNNLFLVIFVRLHFG